MFDLKHVHNAFVANTFSKHVHNALDPQALSQCLISSTFTMHSFQHIPSIVFEISKLETRPTFPISQSSVLVTMSSSCVAFDTSKSGVGSDALVLPQYDSSWENIYGKKDSVHQRFSFDGKLLWEALRRHYFEEPSVQQFIATDYNDDQGKPLPLLERSPLNDRHEAALKETYMATMQESGGHWDGRSKPVIIKPHDPPHPLFKHVLAAAHCVEALYQC